MFRNLRADEIECRIGNVKNKQDATQGYSLLLYKDARCDMAILDETVGPFNWEREHKELKGVIYCGVTINNTNIHVAPLGVSATKWDCGTESNTEAQKGEASDSFKRACFNWGIGRELYTAPFIWVKGYSKYEKFKVANIEYDGKKISRLQILDSNGNIAFSWGKSKPKTNSTAKPKTDVISEIKALIEATGTDVPAFLSYFKVESVEALTAEQGAKAIEMLNAKIAKKFPTDKLPDAMRG